MQDYPPMEFFYHQGRTPPGEASREPETRSARKLKRGDFNRE